MARSLSYYTSWATTCEALLGWDLAKAFALVEGTSFKSTEPARRLHELAQIAQARPAVRTLLDEIDDSVVNRLADVDEEFSQAFDAYQKEFGCRVLNEISEPTLAGNAVAAAEADSKPDCSRL